MDIIEKIKEKANIVDIASNYTKLKKSGRRFVGLCPFHSERTPSFTVDPEKGLYHCFGCGAGGDIFTLVMEKEGLDFPSAIEFLAKKYDIVVPKKAYSTKKIEEEIIEINQSAQSFFRDYLSGREGEIARKYIESRGINREWVETFGIGYSPHQWDTLYKYLKEKGFSENLISLSGLCVKTERGFIDRFRGRIMFPIRNISGRTIGFGGRTIFDENPKYLNSPETPVYKKRMGLFGIDLAKEEIKDKGFVILVEGYMDQISLFMNGFKNTVASLGTSLTEEQVSLLKKFTDKIYLFYDPDNAGVSSVIRAIPIILSQEISLKIVWIQQGFDPDTFVRERGRAGVDEALSKALSPVEFLVKVYNINGSISPEERAKRIKIILNIINGIKDPILIRTYVKELSYLARIEEEFLLKMLKRREIRENLPPSESVTPAEKRLIYAIINGKELSKEIVLALRSLDLSELGQRDLVEGLMEIIEEKGEVNPSYIKEKFSSEKQRIIYKILLDEGGEISIEEIRDCVRAIKRLILERKHRKLQEEIKKEEKTGNKERLRELLLLKQKITQDIITLI